MRRLPVSTSRRISSRLLVAAFFTLLSLIPACSSGAMPTPTIAAKAAVTAGESAASTTNAKENAVAEKPTANGAVAAAKTAPVKLKMGITSVSVSQMLPWLAKDKGIFEKNGLDVELTVVQSAPLAVAALIAGDLHVTMGAQESVITSQFAGGDTLFVIGGSTTILRYLFGARGIDSAEGLRGKSVGVTKFGTSTEFAAKYALRDLGLEPGRDVTLLQVGQMPDIFAALEAGGIQGGTLSPPVSSQAKQEGFKVLYDFAAKNYPYMSAGVIMKKSWIPTHEDVVRSFVRSYIEATVYAKKNKAATIEVIKNFTKVTDPQQLSDAYDEWLTITPDKPYAPAAAFKNALADMPEEPKAKTADPDQFFDNSFVEELDKSGYIDTLFKN